MNKLLAKIKERHNIENRYGKIVDFPIKMVNKSGIDIQDKVWITVIFHNEGIIAKDKAHRFYKNIEFADDILLEDAITVESIVLAYRNPDNHEERIFSSGKEIMENFTTDEISMLAKLMNEIYWENSSWEIFEKSELNDLIKQIRNSSGEGEAKMKLESYHNNELMKIIMELINKLPEDEQNG